MPNYKFSEKESLPTANEVEAFEHEDTYWLENAPSKYWAVRAILNAIAFLLPVMLYVMHLVIAHGSLVPKNFGAIAHGYLWSTAFVALIMVVLFVWNMRSSDDWGRITNDAQRAWDEIATQRGSYHRVSVIPGFKNRSSHSADVVRFVLVLGILIQMSLFVNKNVLSVPQIFPLGSAVGIDTKDTIRFKGMETLYSSFAYIIWFFFGRSFVLSFFVDVSEIKPARFGETKSLLPPEEELY